jgi:hypothetical protein
MQPPNPPAQIDPKALMAILTQLAQTGGGQPNQPPVQNATQLQGPPQMAQLLPMLMQIMGQNAPPPPSPQQQQQAQQQQQQQQVQQQQSMAQPLMMLLQHLGLKLG